MRLEEITEIYKEMGLGTQVERDEFLKWTTTPPKNPQYTTFFVETPNSDLNQTENQRTENA